MQHTGKDISRVTSSTCNLYITVSIEKAMAVSVFVSNKSTREKNVCMSS